MLTHGSPMDTANAVADYFNANFAAMPEDLKPKILAALREPSPVVRIVNGMELLYAVLFREPQQQAAEAETAFNVLGAAADQVMNNGFFAKGERAMTIIRCVKNELGELPEGATAPTPPDVEAEYAAPAWGETPAPAAGEGGQTPN